METIEHIIQQPVKRTHKTPLLFQHGAWHGAWCWQLWLDYFAALGYEVHAISLPGHGQSSLRKGHINFYTLKDYVATLAQQIETISPTPVVIGHSLGGAIVQKYLETHQLPGAVLLASLPAGGILPMSFRLLQRYPLSAFIGLLKLNTYHLVGTPELAQELFLNSKTELDVVAFQKQLVRETYNMFSMLIPFAKVNVNKSPMLLISAEQDQVFTQAEQNATAAKYGVKNIVIKGQAHNLMMESAWQQVADMIDRWLTHELKLP